MTRLRFSEDRGFAMIEAVAAAALLAVVALGVLRGLDVAQHSSGREKARSAAAALTEQEQEKLRSMRAIDLANWDSSKTVSVGKAKYNVNSVVEWVRDSTGGTESCNNSAQQADYMRITTTTKSTLINTPIPPIKMSSIVAPPVGAFGDNQGTLGVQVNDRNGAGVAGTNVTITGPATVTNPTNSAGCAIFAYVPIGAYTASVNSTGWVDRGGNQNASVGATVVQGQVKVANLVYDQAASSSVVFDTELRDGTTVAVKGTTVGASNTGVPAGPLSVAGIRKFGTAGTKVDSLALPGLFPFTDGYGVFGGACAGADPTKNDSDYYTTFPAAHIASEPATVSPQATARLPSLNVRVLYNGAAMTGTNLNSVHVLVKSKGSGCTENFDYPQPAVDAAGWLPNSAVPFGDYQVCADAVTPASGTRRFKNLGGPSPTLPWVQNYDLHGIKPPSNPIIDLGTSGWTAGSC
jgi:Tfp pilus assembly protein PilV